MDEFKKAFTIIKAAKKIALAGHVRPDGDCIGCCLAMRSALIGMGKTAEVFIDGELPAKMEYLSGYDKVITKYEEPRTKYDLLIVLDCSTEDRLGAFSNLKKFSKKILCIDHHIDTDLDAELVISISDSASCGELLYRLFTVNNVKITPEIAAALYTAVSTDTGCFLYSTTTAGTHRIAADLMEAGADIEAINYANFRVFDKKLLDGLQQIIKNLHFTHDGKVSYTWLKLNKDNNASLDNEARNKFQKYASDVAGVHASAFITQSATNEFNVSLRSHGEVNVCVPAQTFGGGGHKNASGFAVKDTTCKKILNTLLPELIKAVDLADKNCNSQNCADRNCTDKNCADPK